MNSLIYRGVAKVLKVRMISKKYLSFKNQINFGAIDISKLNFKHSKQILQAKDFANEFKTLFNQLDRETIARKDVFHSTTAPRPIPRHMFWAASLAL
jgi:hypothetical protein